MGPPHIDEGSVPEKDPGKNPSVCLLRIQADSWRGQGTEKGDIGLPCCQVRPRDVQEAWEAESWSQRLHTLNRLVLTLLGDGGHTGLVAQPFLQSTTQTHSDISFLTCFLKKNLMFSIIHPSQKIIDRARNENLSHIL